MKRILLFALALLCALSARAQINNLRLVDDSIIWQKIYEADMSISDIAWILQCSSEYDDITIDVEHNTISCVRKPAALPYAKYGYKGMDLQIYSAGDCTYNAIIQVKEGKYRVTAFNIRFINKNTKVYDNLDTYAIGKDMAFSKSFLSSVTPDLLDRSFSDCFDLLYILPFLNDEW